MFLCTLPACQQTSAIVWWLYVHSLKSYEALLHIMCFMFDSCIFGVLVFTKYFETEMCRNKQYIFLLRIVFSQKIEDMCIPTIEFFWFIAECCVIGHKVVISAEVDGNLCLFIIIFLPFLIDGILRMDKSCDFWSISSVFVLLLHSNICFAGVVHSTDAVFIVKSACSNCIVLFWTNWCCDCWYESDFAEMFLHFNLFTQFA